MVPFVIVLIAIGLFLVFLEIMLPSGGILGLLATSAIISALVIAFKEGGNGGYMVFLFLIFALPAVIGISFKWLPKSPFGKLLILDTPKASDTQLGMSDNITAETYDHLLGETGTAQTNLRPSGFALIANRRYTVTSRCQLIDSDSMLKVVVVEGNNIIVEQINT
jgi:membrane-bound serine protease (ClpP class)